MSNFHISNLTNAGITILNKAQTGKQLLFTRVGIGDGELGGSNVRELTALKHQVLSTNILKLQSNTTKATIGFSINNTEIEEGFYFREIGIFAQDPDNHEEVLYAYMNSGDTADYIPTSSGGTIEKRVYVDVFVSDVANIQAIINPSIVYATQDDLDELEQNVEDAISAIDTTEYAPRTVTVTLTQANWTQNQTTGYYEYDIQDQTITANHYAEGNMNIVNQEKISQGYMDTYNGGIKVYTTELPESDVTMSITIWKTTNGGA